LLNYGPAIPAGPIVLTLMALLRVLFPFQILLQRFGRMLLFAGLVPGAVLLGGDIAVMGDSTVVAGAMMPHSVNMALSGLERFYAPTAGFELVPPRMIGCCRKNWAVKGTPVFDHHISKPSIQRGRLLGVSSALAVANYYAYVRFKDMWWSYPKSGFHLYRGWRQTQGMYDLGFDDSLWHHIDKFGHFYNTRMVSLLMADAAEWIGFQKRPSMWIGACTAWLFYLQIELFDGQFEEWGFSIGDLLANTAGAFMPLARDKWPALNALQLKFSYHVSEEIDTEQFMVEDYAGMTFWLSANPRTLLPDAVDRFWPAFLNIAAGYGVSQKAHGEVELYLGFDYDLTAIKAKNPLLKRVIHYFNYLHLPAPAIRIRPSVKRYVLYF